MDLVRGDDTTQGHVRSRGRLSHPSAARSWLQLRGAGASRRRTRRARTDPPDGALPPRGRCVPRSLRSDLPDRRPLGRRLLPVPSRSSGRAPARRPPAGARAAEDLARRHAQLGRNSHAARGGNDVPGGLARPRQRRVPGRRSEIAGVREGRGSLRER